jgi:hypothetical protein
MGSGLNPTMPLGLKFVISLHVISLFLLHVVGEIIIPQMPEQAHNQISGSSRLWEYRIFPEESYEYPRLLGLG